MIDTHVHLDHARYKDSKQTEIINSCLENGITNLMIPAITFESNEKMRESFAHIPWIYYAHGIHPGSVGVEQDEGKDGFCEELAKIKNMSAEEVERITDQNAKALFRMKI